MTDQSHHGRAVNAVKWCCNKENDSYLAIGGTKSKKDGANIRLYKFCKERSTLIEIATVAHNPMHNIFSLDWNPDCECRYLTAGGGCADNEHECKPNLFVYKMEKLEDCHRLSLVTHKKFDETITSLDWCKPDAQNCSYLIVGTETNKPKENEQEGIEGCSSRHMTEIGLFKAVFCCHDGEKN